MTAKNPVNLDELKTLLEGTTEGPWEALDLDDEMYGESITGASHGWWWVWRSAAKPYYGGVLENDTDFTITGRDGRLYHVAGAIGEAGIHDGRSPQEEKDARFIAAARNLVPEMIEELEELREIVKQLKQASAH